MLRTRQEPLHKTLLLALLLCSPLACASTEYTISLIGPQQHLVEVKMSLPAGPATRELQLPVWNALYQVRDFAQYLNWIRAKDHAGHSVSVLQLNKSRWQISGAELGAQIEYQIYVDTFGPFGSQLNPHHAFFNLAQILMYAVDARNQPMTVRFSLVPAPWHIATPLPSSPDGTFDAENYDRLVDSPVEIGTFNESDFDESGGHYRVVVDAEPGDYDMQKIDAMLRKLVAAETTWMDDRPFETYTFIFHFPRGPAGGGMEHSYSTAIDVNAEVLAQSPQSLASVAAHEFFHLWNVKRIRPQTLEPVDYTKENYARALWFSEGCTSTAADIAQLRAGLIDESAFERLLSLGIAELERRPAHLTQSVEDSSLDAWLEGNPYYRRPERSISYYNKGELLGIMLDLAVREASHGQASLREVFQWLNVHYAKQGRSFPDSDGVREAAEAVTHADLSWFFTKYVSGTDEIPWNDFFRSVGLRLVEEKNNSPDAGFAASRNFDGPMTVASVAPGSEAERAGLHQEDTILEIDGNPPGQEFSEQAIGLAAGDTITVKLRNHRGEERDLQWKVGSRQEAAYELKNMENISPDQQARRTAWLKGEAQISQSLPSH